MKHDNDAPAHLRHRTSLDTKGEIDMSNRKPFRTKAEKARARELAKKGPNGTYSCPMVPRHYHPPVR
jgi:hypothetical protein